MYVSIHIHIFTICVHYDKVKTHILLLRIKTRLHVIITHRKKEHSQPQRYVKKKRIKESELK